MPSERFAARQKKLLEKELLGLKSMREAGLDKQTSGNGPEEGR
jgi:hypothetical protein